MATLKERFSRAELQPGQRRWSIGAVAADVGLVFWFVFSLFPIFWMLLLALKNAEEQTTTYFAFSPTLENFVTVLSNKGTEMTSVDFKASLVTSLLNCGGAVIVSLVRELATPALTCWCDHQPNGTLTSPGRTASEIVATSRSDPRSFHTVTSSPSPMPRAAASSAEIDRRGWPSAGPWRGRCEYDVLRKRSCDFVVISDRGKRSSAPTRSAASS